ncbi:hypothetical protein SARC_02530, partial [Sphaeroforma arctica JP610]
VEANFNEVDESDEAFLDLVKHFEQEIKAGSVDIPSQPLNTENARPQAPSRESTYSDRKGNQYEYTYSNKPNSQYDYTGQGDDRDSEFGYQHQHYTQERVYSDSPNHQYEYAYNDPRTGKVNDRKSPHQHRHQQPHYTHDREQRRRVYARDEERRLMYELFRDSDRRHEDTRDTVRRTGQEIMAVLWSQLGGFPPQSPKQPMYPKHSFGESFYGQSGPVGDTPAPELQKMQAKLIEKASSLHDELQNLKNSSKIEHTLYVAQNETCTALQLECGILKTDCDALKAECGTNHTLCMTQIHNLTVSVQEWENRASARDAAMKQLLESRETTKKALNASTERVASLGSGLSVCNTDLQQHQSALATANASLAECSEREEASVLKLTETGKALNTSQLRVDELEQMHRDSQRSRQQDLMQHEAVYAECVASLAQQAVVSAEALNTSTRAVATCQSAMRIQARKVYDLHVQVQKLSDELQVSERERELPIQCTPGSSVPSPEPPIVQTTKEEPAVLDQPTPGPTQHQTEETEPSPTIAPELGSDTGTDASPGGSDCVQLTEREESLTAREKELEDRGKAMAEREAVCQREEEELKIKGVLVDNREKQLMLRAEALDGVVANGPGYDIVTAIKLACASAESAGVAEMVRPESGGNGSVKAEGVDGLFMGDGSTCTCMSQVRLEQLEAHNAELLADAKSAQATIQAGIVPLYFLRPSMLMASTDGIVWGTHVYVVFSSVLLFALSVMLAGGMLGHGGMSQAEVDVLVQKRGQEVQQHMQQQMDQKVHRRLSTPEGNHNAQSHERLESVLAERQQMLEDIAMLNDDVASRDRQIIEFRVLTGDMMTSIKQHKEDGNEVQKLKAALAESERVRELKEKTFYELDRKNMRAREAAAEEHAEAVNGLRAAVAHLEGVVKARETRLNELELDLDALNTALDNTRQRAEQTDRSRDETLGSQQAIIDKLRAELMALESKCATLDVAEGAEESKAVKELEMKHAAALEQVRLERDECAQRAREYRESRDQHAREAAAQSAEQSTRLKAEKDAICRLQEVISERAKAHALEVRKGQLWKRYLEKELEGAQSEASKITAELVTVNNKYKAVVEILERHRIPGASQVTTLLSPAEPEKPAGSSMAGELLSPPTGDSEVLHRNLARDQGTLHHGTSIVGEQPSEESVAPAVSSAEPSEDLGLSSESAADAMDVSAVERASGVDNPSMSSSGVNDGMSHGSEVPQIPSSLTPPPTDISPIPESSNTHGALDSVAIAPAKAGHSQRMSSSIPPPPLQLPPPPTHLPSPPTHMDAMANGSNTPVGQPEGSVDGAEERAANGTEPPVADVAEAPAASDAQVNTTPTFYNPTSYGKKAAFPFATNSQV